MKRYNNEELDIKIHTFLDRKFEQYPELESPRQTTPVFSKPNLGERLTHALVSKQPFSAA